MTSLKSFTITFFILYLKLVFLLFNKDSILYFLSHWFVQICKSNLRDEGHTEIANGKSIRRAVDK